MAQVWFAVPCPGWKNCCSTNRNTADSARACYEFELTLKVETLYKKIEMSGFHIMTACSSSTVEEVFAENPSLSADHYKRLYARVLTAEQKEQFAALSVERQMGLLCVPVRRQNRYKKTGLEAYLNESKSSQPRRTPVRVNQEQRAIEKDIAKLVGKGEDYDV